VKWILIIFLFSQTGNQIKHIEFNNQTACNEAGKAVMEGFSRSTKVSDASSVYCVQKGNEPR